MRTVASVEFAVRISVSSEPSVELALDTEGSNIFAFSRPPPAAMSHASVHITYSAVSLVLVTTWECVRCV